jgi:hypothetical protein
VPAELRTLVTSVRLEATVEPTFLKSTVTFVDVPDVGAFGEIACNEMSGDEDGLADDDGLGVEDGIADDDGLADGVEDGAEDGIADDEGLADDDGVVDDEGLADDAIGLGVGAGCPVTWTENDLVARPLPPFQISKPASTSIRYHDGLM